MSGGLRRQLHARPRRPDPGTWTHFDNGKLNTLVTKNGAGSTTESHTVTYTDPSGFYLNGNRATDRYWMLRQAGKTGVTTCLSTAPCDAKYTYDARDRLISHQIRAGKTNTYTLDEPARLIGDATIRAGNVTTEVKGGTTTTRKYQANQLREATTGATTTKFWYDPLGNLDCVTTAAGSQANCSPSDDAGSASATLVADYGYDYLNRLTVFRGYAAGARTDKATYTHDALDRTVREVEDHAGTGKDRSTAFSYQGLTNLVTEEKQTGGTNPATKTFGYDAYGHRIGLTDTVGATVTTYSYGHDVHGSVSQLLTDAGAVRASYGYDAYGGADAPASDPQALSTGDTDNQAPLNPYRYTDRRIDSGTATSPSAAAGYDMGARRYGPDTTRFWQADIFHGALANLGLAADPLTQNRYALAGGNPISYIEWDGHIPSADGGGGAAPAPAPHPHRRPQPVRPAPTPSKRASSRPCWEQLTCQRDDIGRMSVDNRKRMIEWIDSQDRDPEGYFNAIRAVLDFAGDKKLIEPGPIGEGSWFSSLDAIILEGIHDGFALSQGKTGAMYTDVKRGASEWQRFFEARQTDPGDTDLARSLWGNAEQTTTEFAHDVVGEGSQREEVFLENANVWRKTLRASSSVEGLDFCEWEWCEPAIYLLDPRSYTEVRFGADLMWREAGFEAWLPDWITGD